MPRFRRAICDTPPNPAARSAAISQLPCERSVPPSSRKSKKPLPAKGCWWKTFGPPNSPASTKWGAAALSVLTDREFFQGSLDDLRTARAACTLPVIRKDFTLTDYHVLEAAAVGADAILLILAILDDAELRGLRELAAELGMAALVEAHNAQELERAVRSDARIIGINNRDLNTFRVSLDTSVALAHSIPAGVIKVSESGIFNADDIHRLMAPVSTLSWSASIW